LYGDFLLAKVDGQPDTTREKAGVKGSNGTWLGWNDLCKGEQLADEVFGDGLEE